MDRNGPGNTITVRDGPKNAVHIWPLRCIEYFLQKKFKKYSEYIPSQYYIWGRQYYCDIFEYFLNIFRIFFEKNIRKIFKNIQKYLNNIDALKYNIDGIYSEYFSNILSGKYSMQRRGQIFTVFSGPVRSVTAFSRVRYGPYGLLQSVTVFPINRYGPLQYVTVRYGV